MKFLILVFLTLASFELWADDMSCTNVDDYWKDDTLEFVKLGQTTYAYYYNNDSHYSIPCQTTMDDGLRCEEGKIEVRWYESGETIVSNGTDSPVEFDCN